MTFPMPNMQGGHKVGRLVFVGGYKVGFAESVGNTTVSLTSLTGGVATAPRAGDLVIVAYATSGNSNLDMTVATSGYTELTDLYDTDTYDINFAVYWKRLASAETSVDVGPTAGSSGGAVAIHVWRGADNVTPIDVTTTTATGNNGGNADPPSITPVTPGAVILAIGGAGHNLGTTAFTTSLTDYLFSVGGDGSVYDATVGIVAYLSWSSGAYNPPAFSLSGTDLQHSRAAATVALRPST